MTKRLAMTPARRARILARQGGLCAACGAELTDFDVDHVLPLGLDGPDDDGNTEAICIPCHRAKTKADVARIAKAKRQTKAGAKVSRTPLPARADGGWDRRYRRLLNGRTEMIRPRRRKARKVARGKKAAARSVAKAATLAAARPVEPAQTPARPSIVAGIKSLQVGYGAPPKPGSMLIEKKKTRPRSGTPHRR
jgi:hypothetical protein